MEYPSFSLEYLLIQQFGHVAGIDEVGRGCLAGPVVAGIVIITSEKQYLPEVRDSKTLSEKQRERIAATLRDTVTAYGIGSASWTEIDQVGIRKATYLAMLRAYWALPFIPNVILMDGVSATIPILSKTYQYNYGDLRHYAIAAASIIAKVYRDTLMKEYDTTLPGYSFGKHKGYGTALHYQALKKLGPSVIHRRSYL